MFLLTEQEQNVHPLMLKGDGEEQLQQSYIYIKEVLGRVLG